MITRFHTSGEIAGMAKWSCALSIPTSRPLRPSRITIGNITRLRPTARSSSAGVLREERHDHPGGEHEHDRDRAQHGEDQPEQRGGELERLLALLVLEQLA